MGRDRNPMDTGGFFPADLEADDERRSHIEQRKALFILKIEKAFFEPAQSAEEAGLAETVREFLSAVVKNIESYRNKARVADPRTGQMYEVDWLDLCGGTIRELDAPERIKRLVFEFVSGLLPTADEEGKAELAESAGMQLRLRASADNVRLLKRKGMLASFVGKLLVDSKILVLDRSEAQAEAYFLAAETCAHDLAESPYLTKKDSRLLQHTAEKYPGGLTEIVATQKQNTIEEIRRRDSAYPIVERSLRSLLEEDFQLEEIQPIPVWREEILRIFGSDGYVLSRLNDFRRVFKGKLEEAEQREVVNHEIRVAEATQYVLAEVKALCDEAAAHGVELPRIDPAQIDIFELIETHAEIFARDPLVRRFNEFIANEELLDYYADYKISSFKITHPDLKKKIRSDLSIWDEIYRAAPIGHKQEAQLTELKQRLVEQLSEVKGEPAENGRSVFQLSIALLPHMNTQSRFTRFATLIDEAKAIYEDEAVRRESSGEIEALSDDPLASSEISISMETSSKWTKMLADPKIWRQEMDGTAMKDAPAGPGKPSDEEKSRGWFSRLFKKN